MSSHGFLGEPPRGEGDFGPRFRWKCPRTGCKTEIVSWTETGLARLKEPHLDEHYQDDKETLAVFQSKLLSQPIRDYNKLRLTWADVTFLWTRGIAVDETDYDKSAKAAPNAEVDRNQIEWGKILDSVIRRKDEFK
jgi:hypothetical protein